MRTGGVESPRMLAQTLAGPHAREGSTLALGIELDNRVRVCECLIPFAEHVEADLRVSRASTLLGSRSMAGVCAAIASGNFPPDRSRQPSRTRSHAVRRHHVSRFAAGD